jgi:hypothetical protein
MISLAEAVELRNSYAVVPAEGVPQLESACVTLNELYPEFLWTVDQMQLDRHPDAADYAIMFWIPAAVIA